MDGIVDWREGERIVISAIKNVPEGMKAARGDGIGQFATYPVTGHKHSGGSKTSAERQIFIINATSFVAEENAYSHFLDST